MLLSLIPTTFVFFLLSPVSSSYDDININKITERFSTIFGTTNLNSEIPDHKIADEVYDFIIIGSGSSGSVVASRLSEVPSWKILLLEAGNAANILTKIPIMAPLFQLTPYNWNYTMEPEPNVCQAMEDQICAWPRGKALGGTSVINYMIYTRGNPIDYEKWAEVSPGWSYQDVLPYFLKSENCNLGTACTSEYHNTSGPLSVEYPFKSPITDAFLQAGQELGEEIVDYNTLKYMGFGQLQANQKFGRRHSTFDAFIAPIITRKNLHIITGARVTKILIDPNSRKTQGVIFEKRGQNFKIRASKEVILSAGVFNSPQLLMLSGIGPERHLQDLGIPPIVNLPVGQNLYDHLAFLGVAYTINVTVEPREALLNPLEGLNWFLRGKGVYTSLGGVEAIAYINTGSIPRSNYPDIELIFVGTGSLQSDFGLVVAKEIRLKRNIYDKVFKPIENTPSWTIFPMLLHPQSKGYLQLKSTNPYDPPILHGNCFTDPGDQDIKTLLASIRYIQTLAQTQSFQKFGSKLHDIPLPTCQNHIFDSDDYWICAIKSLSTTLHHQIGTCRMGQLSEPQTVVDPRLRVRGIEGLRVIDSSVIPVTLSAHTNAPSIMVGEKGADLVKEDWYSI
ncbi:glucose dehydrogenase [FAD, quinone]-like [Tribolium madens]|uniref:glucose dehydrogenase [FAD, quinone]-like n=1 Tax=Tribolium madens TaxID=41895 RepID=UPI001CF72926|nr:glucose dehydrogenase [FAD, quinone]-like [Tribolium madens]